ncbi:acyl-CoA Delta(11) desaturase-like isoform X1 [Cydia fagiglandana]|uniref:acyl-CoA Delta(11) desaturase-like isoform X1 n=1 Tax=Cydia fagiglandana TaxID=1458189 RepID=UPI002FEE3184
MRYAGRHGGRAPAVGASLLQGDPAAASVAHAVPEPRLPALGASLRSGPQVHPPTRRPCRCKCCSCCSRASPTSTRRFASLGTTGTPSYKATLPLQVLLMLFQSLAYQHSALRFARDHRAHHKFSDTDADPYNPARGFFFAHIGWLLVRKHPQAITRGKGIHVDDLYQNPVLVFQNKYSFHLTSLLAFVLPALVPTYFWQESVTTAHHVSVVRVLAVWHAFFTTNSAAHSHGYRPYDKRIMPTQNLPVTFITLGEGFHNFHHVFPFDYRAAELGNNCLNLTTRFIDVFAWIGWAYDLKHASPDVIAKRSNRTGDGTDLWGRPKEDFVSDSSK